MRYNLTPFPLFESMLEMRHKDFYFDLHNDYSLVDKYIENETLGLVFKSINGDSDVHFNFSNVEIESDNIDLNVHTCIDNFHRGRLEHEDGLVDVLNGKMKIYTQFYEDGILEFMCSKIELEFIKN